MSLYNAEWVSTLDPNKLMNKLLGEVRVYEDHYVRGTGSR